MFHKALTLVLLGVLVMGSATMIYGTFYDKGFAASVTGILGLGDDEHEDDDDD